MKEIEQCMELGDDPDTLPIHPDSVLGRAIAAGGPLPEGVIQVGPGQYKFLQNL